MLQAFLQYNKTEHFQKMETISGRSGRSYEFFTAQIWLSLINLYICWPYMKMV